MNNITYWIPASVSFDDAPMLHSGPTGSERTEGETSRRVRQTVIDCPHQNACREDEDENRGRQRRPELSQSFRAFQVGTSERDEENK